ncbi:hypothetical protein D3C86_1206960 [compost metagenome]
MIHNARASFTVVATSSACGPYLLAAPTTELVSCMAIADHIPNCVSERCKAWPIAGNTNRAMELRIKTMPNATDICLASALMTGPTAAMALPPHIAVPEAIRCDVLRSIFSSLPIIYPSIKVPKIEAMVNNIPSLPALRALCRFIPNPNPTTEIWSSFLVALPLCCR